MSTKKIGRPTESPKNISIRIRFDNPTYEKLDVYSKTKGINKSEAIRDLIIKAYDDLDKK